MDRIIKLCENVIKKSSLNVFYKIELKDRYFNILFDMEKK